MARTAVIVAALCVLAPIAVVASGSPVPTDRSAGADRTPVVSGPSASLLEQRSNASVPLGAPPATPPGNTTAYLAIPPANVSNATVSGVDLDVAGALAADAAATDGRLLSLTIDERLSRANTTAEKRVVIRRTGTRIERRIDRLRTEQRRTIEDYSDDGRSTKAFLDALARIETRARQLRGSIARLETAAASIPGTALGGRSVDAWARDRLVELGLFASPVRQGVLAALEGSDPIAVYAEVSETGVVLAAIDNGRYVREAYLPTERDEGPPEGPASISGALGRVIEVYPWAWNHSTGVRSAGGPGAGSYRFTLFHQQGRLSTYLDSETGAVFREIQAKPLRGVPTAPAVTASEAGLRVAVNRTYATGPMNVSVTAAGSGEPIDATVSIEDRTVGRTGSKGYLWAISPRGIINVTVADGNRTATVRLAADPRLAAGDGEARSSIAARTPSPPESRPTTPVNESTPPANRSTLLANGSTSLRNESALPPGTPPTGSRADSPIANGSDQNATATTAGNRSAPAIAPWVSA
jgi:hypothetical protein